MSSTQTPTTQFSSCELSGSFSVQSVDGLGCLATSTVLEKVQDQYVPAAIIVASHDQKGVDRCTDSFVSRLCFKRASYFIDQLGTTSDAFIVFLGTQLFLKTSNQIDVLPERSSPPSHENVMFAIEI